MNSANCFGCGGMAQTRDLVLTINASAGPRINAVNRKNPVWSHSTGPTVTMNIILCDECLERPEFAVLMELISLPYSEPAMNAGEKCVIMCRFRKPYFWLPKIRQRMQFWPSPMVNRCPVCGRWAVAWPAPLAPDRYIRELAAVTDPGRKVRIRARPRVSSAPALPAPGDDDG